MSLKLHSSSFSIVTIYLDKWRKYQIIENKLVAQPTLIDP